MESFGFSNGLIAKIKMLYQKIESVLNFNGGLCAPFEVQWGIRQGCALSGWRCSVRRFSTRFSTRDFLNFTRLLTLY